MKMSDLETRVNTYIMY